MDDVGGEVLYDGAYALISFNFGLGVVAMPFAQVG